MPIKDKQHLIGISVALWVSFLSAAIATMLFFATFDPITLAAVATFPMEVDSLGGYSIGFLLFWLLCFTNSLAVIWLANHKPNK